MSAKGEVRKKMEHIKGEATCQEFMTINGKQWTVTLMLVGK